MKVVNGLDKQVLDMVVNALKTPKNPAYDFTLEELDALALVSGKEKKKLLKELKAKYDLARSADGQV